MERQRQLPSIDAVDGFEGSGMADDEESPLLGLPSGVERLVVSFLSSWKGGLRNVLTLRAVCRTTCSWVDSLPKSHADAVFSNAQVTTNSDLQSLESFNSSPPPFGVTSLRLKLQPTFQFSPEEEDEWSSFCTFWNPKLESLELQSTARFLFLDSHIAALMDSDKINTITVTEELEWRNPPLPLPSSFQKVSELRIRVFACEDLGRAQFFSLLQSNSNLRVFTFEARGDEDFAGVAQLVDSKRDCPNFQLTLTLPIRLEYSRVFSQLATSILASKSQVRLNLWGLKNWMLLHVDIRPLLSLVEHMCVWFPTQDTLSALTNCPRLNELEHVSNHSISPALLQFPPSLEKLKISAGLPSSANLPEALKELSVGGYKCASSRLVTSFRNLNGRCPELEKLDVWWESLEERDGTPDYEGPAPAFAKLRRLRFMGKLHSEDLQCVRLGLANAFNWQRLELHYIQVGFNDFQHRKLPLLDEEILRNILEGPSATSLLKIEIDDESVAPKASPMLQQLKSLVAENWERRLEAEGPGAWQRHFQYF